jgi:hypothetical protein
MNDKEQTELIERVRTMLQSIAVQAVQAQDCIGSDKCSDLLADIEGDLEKANQAQNELLKG